MRPKFERSFSNPCLDNMELDLDCAYDYNSLTCEPVGWKDPTGYSCRLYQNSHYCNDGKGKW